MKTRRQKACGRQSTLEALRSDLEVEEIFIQAGGRGEVLDEISELASKRQIRLVMVGKDEIERIAKGVRAQGVVAFYQAPAPIELEELLLSADPDDPEPVMVLDGVEDPRNLGAIIRSAEVFGALGVVTRRRRSASVTPAAVKASAGAALRLPVAETPNIDRAIRALKQAGYWVYGLDAEAETSIWDSDFTAPTAFVLGGEGKGLARLTRKRCDALVKIPQVGEIASLNVSVSGAVVLAEWLRQRTVKLGGKETR